MKAKIFSTVICCILSFNGFSTNISQFNMVLFLFKDKENVCIYKSSDKDSIILKIFDDGKAGKLYAFNVLEKKDSMIKVIAWCTTNNKKIKGWIKITDTAINGRVRTEKSVYELYEFPSYKSKKTIVNSYWESYVKSGNKTIKIYENVDENFRVFDINGEWLKVEIKGKNNIYRKWLPKEYQCRIVTGGCT